MFQAIRSVHESPRFGRGSPIGAVSLQNFTVRLRIFSGFEATILAFLAWAYAGFHNWATKLTATYVFQLCAALPWFESVLDCGEFGSPADMAAAAQSRRDLLQLFLNSMIPAYFVGLLAAFFSVATRRIKAAAGDPGPLDRLRTTLGDFIALPLRILVVDELLFLS